MIRRLLTVAIAGLALTWASCAGERAEPSTAESRAAEGRVWFESYCTACHGVSGRGDGPVAKALSTPPADLTRIAAHNGGVFDGSAVGAFIDGRQRLAAHGSPDMPVWGRPLDDRRSEGFEAETLLAPGTIFLIVEYLQSIQER